MSELTGVVAMIHGSASDLDDESIRDYLERVMRGRTPSEEQIADLRRRYELIGGSTHLLERSRQQVDALAASLGAEFKVALGAKHSAPFIGDAVRELANTGVRSLRGVALAPHESRLTTGQYDEAGAKAAANVGLRWSMVRSWHTEPGLIALWAQLLSEALAGHGPRPSVLFSAHSLPLVPGDPYPRQVRDTAAAIAGAAGLPPAQWKVVFQSVPPGVDPSNWLGPNLAESYPTAERVVVAPIGFVSAHLEVLFDIDIQARDEAKAVGSELTRTRMPNEDPRLALAMASAITATI